jgi:murein DD-endopeptidase MepM/ murein hydrolase activator NlpD
MSSKWIFPLIDWNGVVPQNPHPGSFGAIRKHDIHTGVDLYVPEKNLVLAVETGHVVNVENFTGPDAGSPWWLPTKSILIEGPSGVVCYGEVEPMGVERGTHITAGSIIGFVKPVFSEDKIRKDIKGHSNHMLHFELYKHGTKKSVIWNLDEPKPKNLLDPTNNLLNLIK